jgi:predicted enzyme involved in methoxymalonyl-ACP biosynthesis
VRRGEQSHQAHCELTQVNQFNLTTRRYAEGQIRDLMGRPPPELLNPCE